MCHSVYAIKDAIPIVGNDLSTADSTANPRVDDGRRFHAILLNGAGLTGIGSHFLLCNGRQPFCAVFIGERRFYKSDCKARFVRFSSFRLQN